MMKRLVLSLLPLFLAACAAGPDYVRPSVPTPAAFKELQGWTTARPADDVERGAWWSVYQDPVLDGLEGQIDVGNQNLRAYEAAYRSARATVDEAGAGDLPSVALSGTGGRQKASGLISATRTAETSLSWETDLWGKVRRQVESNQAAADAGAAELAAIRLSAQADLATDYFELRYQDSLARLLARTVEAYQRSLDITRNQYEAGTAARSDVVTAETQLKSTRASLIAAGVLRAQCEHAIAILIGKPPADLTIAPDDLASVVPDIPATVPATLLQRRPDIAEAERTLQQENALIGVAVAAYYPDLSLSADFGYSSVGSALFKASNRIWSLAASGSETLFDGGSRQAAEAVARANDDQAVANYRLVVLQAFQNVEDGLSGLRILAAQARQEEETVAAAREAVRIALNEYQAGTASYTTVVTAQATALSAEQTALQVRESRMTTSVSLIEALGGGWSIDALSQTPPYDIAHSGK